MESRRKLLKRKDAEKFPRPGLLIITDIFPVILIIIVNGSGISVHLITCFLEGIAGCHEAEHTAAGGHNTVTAVLCARKENLTMRDFLRIADFKTGFNAARVTT